MIKHVLESGGTRRDARSYLNKFFKSGKKQGRPSKPLAKTYGQVNLGSLYASGEASLRDQKSKDRLFEPDHVHQAERLRLLHTAVVKIGAPQLVDDDAVNSIGRTISQLSTLGMRSIVVVDPDVPLNLRSSPFNARINDQIGRIINALQLVEGEDASDKPRAQRIDNAFELKAGDVTGGNFTSAGEESHIHVSNAELIWSPLRRGIVPVIVPVGVTSQPAVKVVCINANDVIVEMVRNVHGLTLQPRRNYRSGRNVSRKKSDQRTIISIDRIIILDPRGGIPSAERAHAPHVYINLKQEYDEIEAQLQDFPLGALDDDVKAVHTANLQLLKRSLDLLPDSSSGLIVTPEAVTRSRKQPEEESGPQVRTRSKRNPLIHNLLTDKPAISSSLPYGRSSGLGYGGPTSTFVKRGMPLTTIPDVFKETWSSPKLLKAGKCLSDHDVDMPKLIQLIEASFNKKLEVGRFLARVNHRFAGLVVAGDYEGCALFTWESSPSAPGLRIPYLDKFAVLPQSQGTGASVADILFSCMIMDCFPNGVCWRSRAENPVNKWYFERANGAWKIPGSRWTSFWTTDSPKREELLAYEAICRDIPPTWPS